MARKARWSYPIQFVDFVRNEVDIVKVIRGVLGAPVRYDEGKGMWMHICPFHTEKTASFSVWPESQRCHCFGCGFSKDVIGFIIEYHHVGFCEAVAFLAETHKLWPKWRRSQRAKKKKLKK